MKTDPHRKEKRRFRGGGGWSLIEVIATVVLSSVLVTLILPFIGSGIEGSRRALLRMPATYSLRTEMDVWWQTYRTAYPDDLAGLSDEIAAATGPDAQLSYNVLYHGWVDFDAAGVEYVPPPGTENVLRLTLSNNLGERLTTYFFPIP